MKKRTKVGNFCILLLLIIGAIVITFYILSWYKQYDETKLNKPIITDVLREVKYDNLTSVLQERDFLIVYMCTSDETICRNFEKKFKKYIKTENLGDDIVYYNLNSDGSNKSIEIVYDKYKSDELVKKAHDYPTLLIFNEGKIIDVLSSTKKEKISITDVKEFLGEYEL